MYHNLNYTKGLLLFKNVWTINEREENMQKTVYNRFSSKAFDRVDNLEALHVSNMVQSAL